MYKLGRFTGVRQFRVMSARDGLIADVIECLSDDERYPESAAAEIADALLERLPQICLPERGETAAVSLLRPKTAALCFDRVWSPFANAPPEVNIFGGTEHEIRLVSLQILQNIISKTVDQYGPDAGPFTMKQFIRSMFTMGARAMDIDREAGEGFLRKSVEHLSRVFAKTLQSGCSVGATPIYASIDAQNTEYRPGNSEAIVAAFVKLGIVDEQSTAWSQVLEFRRDDEAKRKYRRMIRWLDSNMVGSTPVAIADELALRLEDYQWALRKHGLQTTLGSLSAILDARSLLSAAVAYTTLSFATDQLLASIAALGTLAATTSLHVGKALLNLEDIKRTTNPEVAFVYETKTELGA
jgi:hypothetical protein